MYRDKMLISSQLLSITDQKDVIYIDVPKQRLLYKALNYPISTAKNGCGEQENSFCTPRGWHYIRAKIGQAAPPYSVFKARRPTGEIYTPILGESAPDRDWILTRILWLSGLEQGKNKGGAVDTFRRYIYIHGTPDETPLSLPLSKGCIRMHTDDLIALFDHVTPSTLVYIDDYKNY